MPSQLAESVLNGNRRAIARLITRLENNYTDAQAELSVIYPHTGHAHLVGITGAPGTGKSSLVNQLAKSLREHNRTVAILAIDPTSPFSGGAILGDRIRMQALVGDHGVFIRSMANRGSLGGLARAAHDSIIVLDAAGFDVIMIETVGAGQSEVDIARTAQTVIVVEAPGMGDDVQAIKAGILEIADILVVNKADRAGADRTVAGLKTMLELGHPPSGAMVHHGSLMDVAHLPNNSEAQIWAVPVIKTMALKGNGIDEVSSAIDQHHAYLVASGKLAIRNEVRAMRELDTILKSELLIRLKAELPSGFLEAVIAKLVNRSSTPYNAVQELLEESGATK